MSVPKSERRPSQVEYLVIAQNLEYFYMNALAKAEEDKSNDRKIIEVLADKIAEAYSYITIYYEVSQGSIQGTLADRKKYCKKSFWALREVAAHITVYMRFRMDKNKPVKQLCQQTAELLKACNLLQEQLKNLNNL